jgi:hypothetical protein
MTAGGCLRVTDSAMVVFSGLLRDAAAATDCGRPGAG